MYVRELVLRDFRSWPTLSLRLKPGITLFVGRNGYGKTNIVEAIGYVAHLASHRVSTDAPLVREGQKNARISVTAVNHGRELTAHLLVNAHGKNQAQINRTKLQSPREILGVVTTVLFCPEDIALIRGEPSERRRYVDQILVKRRPRLAGVKADYEKVLRQRTSLLKTTGAALRRGYGADDGALTTLDIWDAQLSKYGAELIHARQQLVQELQPLVRDCYATIAPESRSASIRYRSTVPLFDQEPAVIEASMLAELGKLRDKEIDRGASLIGPHRDDLEVLLGSAPTKGFASHGETWSMVLSLRLAEFQLLRSDGSDPILILDDVFAELDAKRRRQLVNITSDVEQVFITAAVDADLPDNLETAIAQRIYVEITDGDDGRVSIMAANSEAENGSIH